MLMLFFAEDELAEDVREIAKLLEVEAEVEVRTDVAGCQSV